MPEASPSPVSEILALTRDRKFDQATALINDQLASSTEKQRPALQDCKALLDWRISAINQRPLAEGLDAAVLAATRLRENGNGAQVGWAYLQLGYAIGLQGDFERGLEWLEFSIADAKRRNDRTQFIFSFSHQAALLASAGEPERAFALYAQTLSLCEDEQQVQRPAFLSNLAHCRLLQARDLCAGDSDRVALAEEALDYATQAIKAAEPPYPHVRWRCNFIHNQGDALRLLGRPQEAETAYRTGLALAEDNLKIKAELMASYAGLLMELGRHVEAADLLRQADALTPWDPINPAYDRLLELQIELARHEERIAELHALWERRFRRVQDRHQDRLRNVRRFAEMFEELKAVRAVELEIREMAERERERREEQERFLAMLTHELKTPVGVARISLDAMKISGRNAERIERALGNINAIIERCRVTWELEHQKLQPKFEACDLVEIARQYADNCAQPNRVKVLESNLPVVTSDSLLLGIVMSNLLDNALKYSPADSDVTVTPRRRTEDGQGGVEVVVANLPAAAGLPDPEHAFEKYFRGRNAQGKSGSGLGLYLARGIIELLDGRLEYLPNSQRVEFSLWLPA